MALSDAEQLANIQRGFEADAQPFVDAGRQVTSREAEDVDGIVKVTINKRGQLTAVLIDNGWEAALGTGGLGPAVVSAYQRAVTDRAEAFTTQVTEPRPDGASGTTTPAGGASAGTTAGDSEAEEVSGVPGMAAPGEAAEQAMQDSVQMQEAVRDALRGRGSTLSDDAVTAGLFSYMEAVESALDRALGQVEAVATTTVEGASGSGRVRATVTMAGDLQGLELDPSWAPSAHPFNLSRETVEAVNDALRRAALRSAESTDLADIKRLTSDPQLLLEHLRLT
ncbi:YbaB/EbfC family nucleoid-associated protein [Nocardioides sp. Soil805]|uniref:YbaB/EbfC family nucleoid-associated protein n=1 Tax=Nocardioides sp. Soil805 TaxID=1736416 RepID=UPI0007029833|nr:YbaB/EbfC family nucleoid-associated protein [Nocardioides sp. Soil805]KRF34381.1 hypothetical protein ASG94_16935 [Nocardioides sp. Soil805]